MINKIIIELLLVYLFIYLSIQFQLYVCYLKV